MEERLDGTLAIPFGKRYLEYRELTAEAAKKLASAKATPKTEVPITKLPPPPSKNHPWRKSYK